MKDKNLNTAQAWLLVGGLSKPGKMPGWSIGIPAKECNTGGKLQKVEGISEKIATTLYNFFHGG